MPHSAVTSLVLAATLLAPPLGAQGTAARSPGVTLTLAAGVFVRDGGEAPSEPLVLGRAAWPLSPALAIEAGLGATWLCSGASVGACRGARPFGMAEVHLLLGRSSGAWRPYLTAGGGIIGPLSDGETSGADPTASVGAGLRRRLPAGLELRVEVRGRADGGTPTGADATVGVSWQW